MNILAIPATNTRRGLNRQLLDCASRLLSSEIDGDIEVEIVDLNDYEMPIYSMEREAQGGVPQLAQDLFAKIGAADAVIVSFAEYNGSFTSAWKNVYDWMSRIDMGVYQGRKVAMLAATPGPRGGAGVLGSATMSAPFFGAELVGSLGIPTFPANFDAEALDITDADLRGQLVDLLRELVA